MASPHRILFERGLAPQKGLGQNFLVDPQMGKTIVHRAALPRDYPVLEVGPGLGALTRPLLEAGYDVRAVEIDRGLADYLREELSPHFPGRITIIREDVLKSDLPRIAGPRFSVIGNLPYVISTPLLFKLIQCRKHIARAVLMFQKELADRLNAVPNNKTYGRLSVMLGYYCHIEKRMDLGPESFYPRPKVGSTVVSLQFKESPQPSLTSEAMFQKVVAAGFSRRRKTLQNALRSGFKAEEAARALEKSGIDPQRRAETLSVEEFVYLANQFGAVKREEEEWEDGTMEETAGQVKQDH